MSKNKYLILSEYFVHTLKKANVPRLFTDRLKLTLLISSLNTKGKEFETKEVATSNFENNESILISDLPAIARTQEVNIAKTMYDTPLFTVRKENVTFMIEQNHLYYQSEFGKPFTIIITHFDSSNLNENHECYFEDIESYLLKELNDIRL